MTTLPAPQGRWATRIGWGLVLVSFVLAVGTLWLRTRGVPLSTSISLGAQAVTGPMIAAVGAVVVSRPRGRRMGWFLVGLGSLSALDEFFRGVAARQALPTEDLTMAGIFLASDLLGGLIWMGYSFFLPFLFPDGDVPSPRWRPFLWFGIAVSAVVSLAILLDPGPIHVWRHEQEVVGAVANPFGVVDLTLLEDGGSAVALLLVFVALAALVVRWRRDAVTRRQIKWILFGFLVAVAGVLLTTIPVLQNVGDLISSLAFAIIPVTIGLAITRYRLFEIDRLVSRSVSYAIVAALLAGLYAAGVLGLGALARGVSGSAPGDLVVALSTLIVAAAFQPVRRRVQTVVDRRFNRARYDAARTAESFGRSLRDELDGEAIAAALGRAAGRSLQPQGLSVLLTTRSG